MARATLELPPQVDPARRDFGSPVGTSPVVEKFIRWSWVLVAYNLLVVAWGAFVRASFSGDGCGSHWPTCGGTIIPAFASFKQIAEFSHRISSGLVIPMAIALVYFAFRLFPKGSQVRRGAVLTLFFTLTEGAVGAGLVLYKLVAHNDSVIRTVSMCAHMANTFLLLGALTFTILAASGVKDMRWQGQGPVGLALGVGFVSVAILGISGACSALGHMLRPTDNVIGQALSDGSSYLVKLQLMHPFIAGSVGLYLVFVIGIVNHFRPDEAVKQAGRWMLGIYGFQVLLGTANIWLKAPIAMQMAHLVLADALWIAFVVVAGYALRDGLAKVEATNESAFEGQHSTGMAMVKQYVALTKPRVISLLLFTTLATMFIAARGWPGFGLFLAVAVGGYLAAGAANAINMVIDRDIDGTMKRTAKRPTVTQDIPSTHALTFGFVCAGAATLLLTLAANVLTALMAMCGLVFYVVVYTLMLKRRTWQNIVIGGAAGAFPPLVGWAAVTNSLPALAWVLFAIIFVWTPVHFWALALLIKDDYAAAGVPMLPVVRGDQATVRQIAVYSVLTVIVTVVPFMQRQVGWLYLGSSIALNVYLLVLCAKLYRSINRPQASRLFHYSMLYLAALFLMVAIDRVVLA